MLRGFTRNMAPHEILTDRQVEAIHGATLEVLQRVGVRFEHQRALKLFADHGNLVDFAQQRVRIRPGLVEECLRRTPSSFMVTARDPGQTLRIDPNTLYFENSIGARILDLTSGEARPATMREQDEGVRTLDALPTVHHLTTYTPYMEIEGILPCMTLLESLASRFRNSTKSHSVSYSNDSEVFAIEMAKTVGIDLLGTIVPSSPLAYSRQATEALFRFVESRFPVCIGGGTVMGVTGPVTIAGSAVTTNAELLAGVVLAQIAKPGVGILLSDSAFPMDMRTAQPGYGAPESALHNAVCSQIWRSYGIPISSWVAGISSAKTIDFQCGCEKAMMTMACALAGANLISLHGAVYGEWTFHPVQAVLDDDVAGMVGRFIQGVQVSQETMALDLIEQIGPTPGSYLATEHSRKWWRREHFRPRVMDRTLYPTWISRGKKSALHLAKERLRDLLAEHEPMLLSEDQDREIEKILQAARTQYREKGLM